MAVVKNKWLRFHHMLGNTRKNYITKIGAFVKMGLLCRVATLLEHLENCVNTYLFLFICCTVRTTKIQV